MMPAQNVQSQGFFPSGGPEKGVLSLAGAPRKVEQTILKHFIAKEYQKLREAFQVVPVQTKEKFFEQRGASILYHAVANSNDLEALRVITENVSASTLRNLLKSGDFEILKGLVAIQYARENYVAPGETEDALVQQTALFHEKLSALSRIAPELLDNFLEKHLRERYMSESIVQIIRSVITPARSNCTTGLMS